MIDTSEELINNMRADVQTTSARVTIVSYKASTIKQKSNNVNKHLKEVGICEDLEEVEVYENYNMPQLKNLKMHENGNYAVFEGDGISLSGVQCISKTNNNNQFGWWSEYLSDEDGYFNPSIPNAYPILECDMKEIGQDKLNIVFSKEKNEYAVKFDVEISYMLESTGKEETKTYNIDNNNSTVYTLENIPDSADFYGNFVSIVIKIYKWSKANARAKICQICFGDILEYEDDNIVSLNGKKGVSLTNENTESKELDLTIQDEEEEYNIFEPTGKLVNLDSGSVLSLELGCLIDDFIYYVKIDEFNLSKPKKEQNSLEVSITGKGFINQCSDIDFGANFYDKTEPQLILDSVFGYEEEIYFNIDEEIKNDVEDVRTEYGTVKIPEGINKLATAIRANVIETIDNKVLLTRIKEKEPVATIRLEQCMELPTIEKEDIPSEININIYSPTDKGNETIYEENLNLIQDEWNIFKYNKEHTAPPYTAKRTLDISGEEMTVDMQGVIFLEDRAGWNPASGGYSKITITGHVVEISSTTRQFSMNKNGTSNQSIENESIGTTQQAERVFKWLKDNYNKCFKYEVEIQDTFTYELGDTVWIETGIYVNGIQIVRKAIIINIEYEYNGALTYILTLKGA